MAKRKPKKPAVRKPVGAATYVIDDRGGMQIADGQQTIKIEREDVRRLVSFLDQHVRA